MHWTFYVRIFALLFGFLSTYAFEVFPRFVSEHALLLLDYYRINYTQLQYNGCRWRSRTCVLTLPWSTWFHSLFCCFFSLRIASAIGFLWRLVFLIFNFMCNLFYSVRYIVYVDLCFLCSRFRPCLFELHLFPHCWSFGIFVDILIWTFTQVLMSWKLQGKFPVILLNQ